MHSMAQLFIRDIEIATIVAWPDYPQSGTKKVFVMEK